MSRAWIVGIAFAAGLLALPATVEAEQCSSDGAICLITDTSQPLATPTTLQLRTRPGLSHLTATPPGTDAAPVGPGLWEMPIPSAPFDSTVQLSVLAWGDGSDSAATFSVALLQPVANLTTTLRRHGEWFIATTSYDARVPVLADIRFALEGQWHNPRGLAVVALYFKRCLAGKNTHCHPGETPAGLRQVVQKIPVPAVTRVCGELEQCRLTGSAVLKIGILKVDAKEVGTANAYRQIRAGQQL